MSAFARQNDEGMLYVIRHTIQKTTAIPVFMLVNILPAENLLSR
jgi:hypothetical protein